MICHDRVNLGGWALRLCGVFVAAVLCLLPWTGTASAHGSVIDPPPATTAAGSAGATTSRTRPWRRKTRCAGRPGRPTRTPCGTGTACTARASAATTRPPSRTASCAAAAGPRAAGTTPWTPSARGRPRTIADDFTVQLYDQASHGADYFLVYVTRQGFDPATQRADLGRPRAGRRDGQLRAQPGLRDPGEHLRAQRPSCRLHDLAGAPHGPDVLPLQRRELHLIPRPAPSPGPAGRSVRRGFERPCTQACVCRSDDRLAVRSGPS